MQRGALTHTHTNSTCNIVPQRKIAFELISFCAFGGGVPNEFTKQANKNTRNEGTKKNDEINETKRQTNARVADQVKYGIACLHLLLHSFILSRMAYDNRKIESNENEKPKIELNNNID